MPDSDTSPNTNKSIKTDETSAPATRSNLSRWFRTRFYSPLIEPLVGSRNPPWYDARGVAIGVIVGFGTPVGAHTAAVLILRLAVRFNFVVALAFTWVCNPFNVIFLYYGYYYLGSFILGRSTDLSFHMFEKLILPITEKGHFWEAISEFMQLSQDLLARWFAAAVLLSVVSGVWSYFLTRYVQTQRCKKTAQKMGVEYEKLVTELEEKVAASDHS